MELRVPSRSISKRVSSTSDPNDKSQTQEANFNLETLLMARKPAKPKSKLNRPLVLGRECPKRENISPYIQLSSVQGPYCLLAPPKTKQIIPLTEEALDDWFAQSQNRKIENLMLAKKDYSVPAVFMEGLRSRWSQKPRPFLINTSELHNEQMQEKKYYTLYHSQGKVSPRMLINEPLRLLFDYSLLQPKNVEGGTSIKKSLKPRRLGLLYDAASAAAKSRNSCSNSPSKVRVSTPSKHSRNRNFTQAADDEDNGTIQIINDQEDSLSIEPSFSRVQTSLDKKSFNFSNLATNAFYTSKLKKVFGKRNSSKEKVVVNEESNTTLGTKAAEFLRQEEIMKENDEFLAKLIVRLNSMKDEAESQSIPEKSLSNIETSFVTPNVTNKKGFPKGYGDIGMSTAKQPPQSQQQSSRRSPDKRSEINTSLLASMTENKETVEAFSRLKRQIKADQEKHINEKRVKKLLPLEYANEVSNREPRSSSTRPTTTTRRTIFTRRLTTGYERDSTRASPGGVQIPKVESTRGAKEIYAPKRKNANLSFDLNESQYQLNTEMKENITNRFFTQMNSSPVSSRKFDLTSRQDENLGKSSAFRNYPNTNRFIKTSTRESYLENESFTCPTYPDEGLREQSRYTAYDKSSKRQVTVDLQEELAQNLGKDTQFWFVRGSMQMEKGNFLNAIDCFKQILTVDPQYYLSIFNIGCMYERLGKLDTAKKWLALSNNMEFCKAESTYGLALCAFKENAYQECYDYLVQVPEINSEVDVHVNYLRALCCKELKKYELASENYHKVIKIIKQQASSFLAQHILTKLFVKARTGSDQEVGQSREEKDLMADCMQFLHEKKAKGGGQFDEYLTPEKEWKPDQEWKPDYVEKTVQKLWGMKFWSRYPLEYIKTFVGYIQLEKFKANDVVYLKKNTVYCIISGAISLRDHSQNFLQPKVIGYLEEGDIIGSEIVDGDVYYQVENWLVCHSDVEVWAINRPEFEIIWNMQKTLSKNIYTDVLNEAAMFKRVSTQTIYKIAYDISKREIHQAGVIIYNDNTYITASEFNSRVKSKVLDNQMFNFNDYNPMLSTSKASSMFTSKVKDAMTRHRLSVTKGSQKKRLSKIQIVPNQAKVQPTSTVRGFFIILSGECQVENVYGYACATLTRGDFFGENLLLETKAYNNFGLIRCKTAVETLFVPESEFSRIPRYEVSLMYEDCLNRKGIRELIESNVIMKKNPTLHYLG